MNPKFIIMFIVILLVNGINFIDRIKSNKFEIINKYRNFKKNHKIIDFIILVIDIILLIYVLFFF